MDEINSNIQTGSVSSSGSFLMKVFIIGVILFLVIAAGGYFFFSGRGLKGNIDEIEEACKMEYIMERGGGFGLCEKNFTLIDKGLEIEGTCYSFNKIGYNYFPSARCPSPSGEDLCEASGLVVNGETLTSDCDGKEIILTYSSFDCCYKSGLRKAVEEEKFSSEDVDKRPVCENKIYSTYSEIAIDREKGELTELDPSSAGRLKDLLRANGASSLEGISDLICLQKLKLYGGYNIYIDDISLLSSLTNLEELDIGSMSGENKFTDISSLSKLSKLRWLSFGGSRLYSKVDYTCDKFTDLSTLSDLVNLEYLSLSGVSMGKEWGPCSERGDLKCSLQDVSFLSSLINLETLKLSGASISDLSVLENLKKLKNLDLSYTCVSDLSSLSLLNSIEKLDLSDTSVSDLSPLSSLTNLKELDLSDTSVSDLSPLSSLTNLKELDLSDTSVSDLSPLDLVPSLEKLSLFDIKVSKEECELFEEKHPSVIVIF